MSPFISLLIVLYSVHLGNGLPSKCSVFQPECHCNPTSIDSSQRCDYIDCCCNEIIGNGIIHYFDIIYCQLDGDKHFYLPLLIICIIYLLIALAIISQHYFAELMQEIAKYLHIRQNVAGATFVAWGNGIATMSSSITAISHGGEQIQLGLGALFGVAVFNISFICATIACIAHHQKPKINPYILLRDGIYLVFVSFYVIMASFIGSISVVSSCFLLLTYIIYVLCIWLSNIYAKYLEQKKFENTFKKTVEIILESTLESIDPTNNSDVDSYELMQLLQNRNDSLALLLSQSKRERMQTLLRIRYKNMIWKILVYIFASPLIILWLFLKLTVPLPNLTHWHDSCACLHCMTVPLLFYFVFIWDRENFSWYHFLCLVCIGIILSVMVGLMLRFRKPKSLKTLLQHKKTTIDVNESTYGTIDTYQHSGITHKKEDELMRTRSELIDNMLILEHDYFGDEDYFYQSNQSNAFLSDYKIQQTNKEPVMKGLFLFLSFIALISWIRLISGELVRILTVLGIISQIDLVLLGTFVLSLSSSIPDLMNNASVAIKGNAKMAVAACFGGASLQICIGFSVGTLIGCIKDKHHIMEIQHSKYVLIGCLFTNISCSIYAAIVSCNEWRLNKVYTICGYICYLSFVLVVLIS